VALNEGFHIFSQKRSQRANFLPVPLPWGSVGNAHTHFYPCRPKQTGSMFR